jgi:hypothetical protein
VQLVDDTEGGVMTVWLILLLVWLAGIPAAVIVTAAIGSRWHEHRLARASRAYRKRAARLVQRARDPRCGRRGHPGRFGTWAAPRGNRRAAGRRPV